MVPMRTPMLLLDHDVPQISDSRIRSFVMEPIDYVMECIEVYPMTPSLRTPRGSPTGLLANYFDGEFYKDSSSIKHFDARGPL